MPARLKTQIALDRESQNAEMIRAIAVLSEKDQRAIAESANTICETINETTEFLIPLMQDHQLLALAIVMLEAKRWM